jgi:uncharacterized membrane protein YgaE (UPF0421/DUF939 family)
MLQRLFLAHPRSVSESYSEHFGVAWRFGLIMLGGGLGALVHALIPALCTTTGSDALARLNALLEAHRQSKIVE